MSDETATVDAPIQVRHVSKSFSNKTKTHALDDVSLDVRRGELVSIVGRSGVGKSTLLRLIGGLLNSDSGEISIFGESVERSRAQKMFGFMPQRAALLPWRSVLANVALMGELNQKAQRPAMDALEALRIVGLEHAVAMHPSELSGGMQQRVAFARAIAAKAPVLLLDEPFSALDEVTRSSMHHYVETIRDSGDYTMVLVTHNVGEAVALSDRVVVLGGAPGRVVFSTESRATTELQIAMATQQVRSALILHEGVTA